ncbi:MAG: class I SAM-dependent methyltransferase [Acidobacteria bacterium]|nr:class I SAM-dependent methyltransferase [Acidobacteriota bacterium]
MSHPIYNQSIERSTQARAHWREADYLAKREMLADLLDCRRFATGRLLDVGCGNKPYLEIFASCVHDYIGVDPDSRFSRPDIVATILDLPFEAAAFDAVLATQVIEHVSQPDRMLMEINRVLKPGGHLILTAPQYWRLHEIPHDYYRFTQYGLQHLVKSCGLTPVLVKEQGAAWAVIGQAICNTLQGRRGWHRIIPFINLVFGLVDRRWRDRGDALNHLIVARK